jgi:hypothetical protein
MSDFEDRISAWRTELSAAMQGRPDVVDELEDHLRQELEMLTRAGKTSDEAWDAALTQLGEARKLTREFAKSSRAGWLPTRAALAVLVACGLASAAFLLVGVSGGRFGALLAVHIFAITLGYAATFAFGFAAASAVVSHARGTFGPRQSDALRRAGTPMLFAAVGLTFVGIVLGAIWLRANRGHYWGWDAREIGGLCVLAWNAAALACLRRGTHAATMLAGVVGNAVVAAGWFGAVVIEPPRAQGVPGWYAAVLAAFIMSQLALALAGMLPAGWLNHRASGQGTA